jgi:LacI family transcriptional regulator
VAFFALESFPEMCYSPAYPVPGRKIAVATLRDVAKRVGLSPATVSRALTGHPYVDDETRRKVVRAAGELGYRPNALARALRVQSTKTIGLIIPDIRNDFYAESASVLQGALEERGYRLILCISKGDPNSDRSYLRTLAEQRVDGIVHVPSGPISAADLEAGGRPIPLVQLLRHTRTHAFDAIVSDDREGAATLTRHLIEQGHRRIAMLTGPDVFSTTRYRIEGYRQALREAGIPASEEQILYGAYSPASGYAQAQEVLFGATRPTAIFSSGSPLTGGVLRALAQSGVRVPDDISLVAYEDPEWYSLTVPPLTCYALPLREMGRIAAEVVTSRLGEDTENRRPPTVLRFSGQLVVRSSTAPPSG